MATMSQIWPIFTAVLLLALQLCIGNKSCTIWSSSGHMVQRGSSFTVYCTFYCKCKGSMYSDHPPTPQSHKEFNSTTIYFNVVNITKNRTYSCQCSCSPVLDPCGLDISAGYPPDRPKNISCIYKVMNNESGVVFCNWSRGRNTYLKNTSVLWVRTVSGNHIDGPDKYPSKRTDPPSVSFPMPRTVQLISVQVEVQNPLGSNMSSTINYTLSDIAMPPAPLLVHSECSSRECIINVTHSLSTKHLEIQYKSEGQTWTTFTSSSLLHQGANAWPISSLEPYKLYNFRARSKLSTGLWSQWSTNISSCTQEEAPAKELDVWYAKTASESLRVYWKEANTSISRGKIIQYILRVHNLNSGLTSVTNISCDARNYSVPFCDNCEVTMHSRNSKGLSPPAKIISSYTQAKPPRDVRVTAGSDNVIISWRKAETAPAAAAYVVEWYPKGHKLEELKWVRLSGNDSHTLITGIREHECYEGAVFVFYSEKSVDRTSFTGVIDESAPAAGPLIQEKVEGNTVTVSWTELPRSQRRGCITNYTIYLERDSRPPTSYHAQASDRMYIIEALSPASYSLWMTASTAKGEGREGQKVKFYIQQSQLFLLLVCGVISLILLFLVCLCQSSAVKQRFWVFFQCLILDVVPDPANSKWAKECTQDKGKMNLQMQLSNSSVTKDEEEPILVDVEELPKKNSLTSKPMNVSSQHPSQTSLNPETNPATQLYPLTTYIKSFSHDSDSSDHTQTSLDTNTTIDYISSHGPENMAEEDREEEEGEFAEMLGFFPSHNVFMEPMDFGGKLTLDAVKIDCSDFFQNI